jgi:hypothetical protein
MVNELSFGNLHGITQNGVLVFRPSGFGFLSDFGFWTSDFGRVTIKDTPVHRINLRHPAIPASPRQFLPQKRAHPLAFLKAIQMKFLVW